jgi:hypothetical protein
MIMSCHRGPYRRVLPHYDNCRQLLSTVVNATVDNSWRGGNMFPTTVV